MRWLGAVGAWVSRWGGWPTNSGARALSAAARWLATAEEVGVREGSDRGGVSDLSFEP